MKTRLTFSSSMAAMTLCSLSACAGVPTPVPLNSGRLIEFQSGPEGFDTRTFFFEGASEVIAFDAQFTPELAQKSIDYLRKITQKPISWLVITHPNPDKFNGASVFRAEGARVVTSNRTALALGGVHLYKKDFFVRQAKMFTEQNYPRQAVIDETFEDDKILTLQSGEQILLKELHSSGVSTNQTVAWVPSLSALVVGDLIHYKAHAWLEGGIVNGKPIPTLESWKELLIDLSSHFASETLVFGGRGETTTLKRAVDQQLDYLTRASLIVRNYLEGLGVRVKELSTDQAGVHYQALTQIFQREFPEHQLPYMIQYGIYGLVQFELARLTR